MKQFISISTLICLFLFIAVSASAQKDKDIKKADEYYKQYRYSLAIPLYEEYLKLNDKKANLAIKTKLAYCYRMNNKPNKAEDLYKAITEHPKARPITFYYYGEILMANGKYSEAKKMFLEYDLLKPDDERGLMMAEACDKVKTIEPLFAGSEMLYLEINTDADDFSPMIYNDQLIFVSDQLEEKALSFARKSEWTGRSMLKLLTTKRGTDGNYSEIEEFSKRINLINKNSGPIVFSRDLSKAYFTRNSDVTSKKDRYNMQIFETEYANDKWKRGSVMDFCSPEHNYMHPAVSVTGDTIYFVSDRPSGFGGTDIYMSWKTNRGWQRPVNLGPAVNSPDNEGFPYIHKDGTLYFSSKGHAGFGGFDIFRTRLDEEGLYSEVKNLGQPINSTRDDTGFVLAEDGQSGYVASSRRSDNDDIYHFRIYDIWIDGKLVDDNTNQPISNATIVVKTSNSKKELKPAKNGKFTHQLALNKDYTVAVNADGYLPFEQNISTKNLRESTAITINAILKSAPLANAAKVNNPTAVNKTEVENTEPTQSKTAVVLSVTVEDYQTHERLSEVTLWLTNRTTKALKRVKLDANGTVNVDLEGEIEYLLKAEKKGYFAYTTVVDTRGKGVFEVDTISLDLELKNIATNQTFQLKNIYYESGKHDVTKQSAVELDRLAEILKSNPTMVIEISSHTDSRGSDSYNLQLSEKRALAARQYLILKGITPDRLKAKGYGETRLLNDCGNTSNCTDEQHSLNRRTEVEILKY